MALDFPYKHLEGRLEVVDHNRVFSPHLACAKLGNTEVIIDPVPATPKERYVIRFQQNNRQPEKPPLGSFITSQIPEDFKGLALDDYVLVGLWEKKMMHTRRGIPALYEIEQCYGVCGMEVVVYLEQGPKKAKGAKSNYEITPRETIYMAAPLDQTIRRLPDPTHTPRVILAETEDILEEVTKALIEKSLVPVRMEALR